MILLSLLLACGTSPQEPPQPPAPQFPPGVIVDLKIDELEPALLAKSDSVRVVNFWAHWCQPCIAELPMLKKYAAENPEVQVVLVNVDTQSVVKSRVEPFIEKVDLKGLGHVHLDDPDPAVALRTLPDWPDSIPVTWIVTPEGVRKQQFTVAVDYAKLQGAVADAR